MPLARSLLCAAWLTLAGAGVVPAAGFTLPEPADLPDLGDNPNPGFTFHPFGWSTDGKFAYLESRSDDEQDGTIYSYVIVDTVKDSEVYRHDDDSLDWPDSTEDSPAESWRRSSVEVTMKLEAFGIRQTAALAVRPFPLVSTGDRYSTDLEVTDDPQEDEYSDTRVQSYTLTLLSHARGSKLVAAKDHVAAADVRVEGQVVSPWEPRILIVVAERRRVPEGYQDYLAFYGAYLPVGFKM